MPPATMMPALEQNTSIRPNALLGLRDERLARRLRFGHVGRDRQGPLAARR